MAFDQATAGPLVVGVVECAVVVVVVVGAPEPDGDELQAAATTGIVTSATAKSAGRNRDARRCTTS
jgi:hypothetical protein